MNGIPSFSSDSYIPFGDIGKPGKRNSIGLQLQNRKWTHSKTRDKSEYSSSKKHPWKKSAEYSYGVVGLHEEINDFYETMKPTEEEREIREKAIEHVTKVVHSLWPRARVEIFGSFRTGLYLPSSDIDMVIFGQWSSLPLNTLSEALYNSGIKQGDINVIASAKVPLIRLLHSPSKIKIDISFNMENGVKTCHFIKKMIKTYPVLPKLVYVLKQFLTHRGLNEVYSGGMSSYCLTLLVVSMLQGFHKPKCQPSTNLGTLLLEFLELYGVNFNYNKVSIHFDESGKYQARRYNETSSSYLQIEDPLVPGHDVAKGTYLMPSLKASFHSAFCNLSKFVIQSTHEQQPVRSFLEKLFQVEEHVLLNRQMMHCNCQHIIRRISHLIDNIGTFQSSASSSRDTSTSNVFSNAKHKKLRLGQGIDRHH